ncbi:MAG: PKD domain-containing protein, partial [Methylophaga sp.]|nr:PKD domain-containing protein [Methylophaga sp.]
TVIADTNTPPTAVISATPISGTSPLLVTFEGTSSYDTDGSLVLYAWDFGDGNSATGSQVNHTYNTAGTFTASLTVTDDTAATSTTTVSINVTPQATLPSAPTNLSATLVKTGKGRNKVVSSAVLNWTDNSNNETRFVIERCLEQTTGKGRNRVTSCEYSEYTTVDADVNSSQVSTESGYKYRVKAINDTGSSSYTNEVSI